jgi:hypothetical protein
MVRNTSSHDLDPCDWIAAVRFLCREVVSAHHITKRLCNQSSFTQQTVLISYRYVSVARLGMPLYAFMV